MPKRQVTVGLDAALLEAVDAYRNRLQISVSRSRAVEALVRTGLRAIEPQLSFLLSQEESGEIGLEKQVKT